MLIDSHGLQTWRLVELMNQDEDRRLAFDSACALIAHAHGRPLESIKIEQTDNTVVIGYSNLEEMRQSLLDRGIPLDRLTKPKLINHE